MSEPEPVWPGDDWQDHCGDPDCTICDGDIPPDRLALWSRWRRWHDNQSAEPQ